MPQFFRLSSRALLLLAWLLVSGCSLWSPLEPQATVWLENPITVSHPDREFVWNQLVDELDDYFPVAREERIRQAGDVLTEGRIETWPVAGATILEPWRRDSTPGFERRHATLQSVRRRAIARMWPVTGGYQIEVVVLKELEDVERPELSPGNDIVFRHDGSVVRQGPDKKGEGPYTLGWIPLGRDLSLEQQILAELQARLDAPDVTPPSILPLPADQPTPTVPASPMPAIGPTSLPPVPSNGP